MRQVIFTTSFLLAAANLTVAAPVGAQSDAELLADAQSNFAPIPKSPPELPGNVSTPARAALGKMLYFDPRLSESHAISCNSCHSVGMGGTDLLETSIGHRWQRGGRNAPTVLNAVFNTAQFWDGRARDLEEQAGGPMINPIEMAATHDHVVEMLNAIPGYRAPFEVAFPGEKNPITIDNVLKAVAVFEATLITPDGPFDRFLSGDTGALDARQKSGLRLFIDKGCAGCHSGVNVGGGMYAPFGVVENPGAEFLPPDDKGRLAVTKTVNDEYVFKVPTLRNIALTAPYFHTGKAWDLRQAVAIMGTSQLGETLKDGEIDEITAFLGTLTGKQPSVTFPNLPPSVATTPRPHP